MRAGDRWCDGCTTCEQREEREERASVGERVRTEEARRGDRAGKWAAWRSRGPQSTAEVSVGVVEVSDEPMMKSGHA
jgi:hypothetical protein